MTQQPATVPRYTLGSRCRLLRMRPLSAVAVVIALCAACSPRSPRGEPQGTGAAVPTRLGAPRYEGCYVAFDRATPTPDPDPDATDTSGEYGRVTLWWSLDTQSPQPFKELRVRPLDCAGAGRGPVRDFGWRALSVPDRGWLAIRSDGTPVLAATGRLPAGRYDRVFVALDEAEPGLIDRTPESEPIGERALHGHVEPISIPFSLAADDHIQIEIVLTVQRRVTRAGVGWNVFARVARAVSLMAPPEADILAPYPEAVLGLGPASVP